jgi:hypothetical protein
VTALAACVVALVGTALTISMLWSLRGETGGDRPGERTCATFGAPLGGPPAPGGDLPGRQLVLALCTALSSRGTTTSAPSSDTQRPFWWFRAGAARIEISIVGEGEWDLVVLDPSSAGPGPIEVAVAVDAALRRVAGVERIRWHARQRFLRRDREHGHDAPIDRPTPGYRG